MPIDKSKITNDMLEKAAKCKTADELIALAKKMGVVITKEQAEAYMTELQDYELDDATLARVAGGVKTCYMVDGCAFKCGTLKDC